MCLSHLGRLACDAVDDIWQEFNLGNLLENAALELLSDAVDDAANEGFRLALTPALDDPSRHAVHQV
jgi:hypothetical protein